MFIFGLQQIGRLKSQNWKIWRKSVPWLAFASLWLSMNRQQLQLQVGVQFVSTSSIFQGQAEDLGCEYKACHCYSEIFINKPSLRSLVSLAQTACCTKQHFSVSTGSSSAEEIVTLLVQAGLFDTAIMLCQTFKLPLSPIFEGLAFKYV